MGNHFEDEIRALADNFAWYHDHLPLKEVFRLWVAENLRNSDDSSWIFHPVRARERKYFAKILGVPLESIVGLSPRRLADILIARCELPSTKLRGPRYAQGQWEEEIQAARDDDDNRVASKLRQYSERFLRTMLYFHCSTSQRVALEEIVANPRSLRVPPKLAKAVADATEESVPAQAFSRDEWADLGFLSLLLRKISNRAQSADELAITGSPLILYEQEDFDAFELLSRALQAYTHDSPSRHPSRKDDLIGASLTSLSSIQRMVKRSVVPSELLVLETGRSLVGPLYRGLTEGGTVVTLSSSTAPPLGARVLFLRSTNCDYARSAWAICPWPAPD